MRKTDKLDPDKITANLQTKRIGRKVLVYKNTSSTNDIAAEYAKNIENDGMVFFAEEQRHGRGRAANKWTSPKANSILCSILLTKGTYNTDLLSLTCAVAIAEAIGNQAKIKWPNDIIINNKKVAGILLESKPNNNHTNYIIGIGINCHQNLKSFPSRLRQTATSLDIETQTTCDRISLAKRLLTSMDHWLDIAEDSSGQIIDQWQSLSIQLGHRITLLFNGTEFTGNCIGIDPQKGLIVQLETGGVRMFDAAHSSIVK